MHFIALPLFICFHNKFINMSVIDVNMYVSHGLQSSKLNKTCVCETRMPPAATKSKYDKISWSQILTPPHRQGHAMSVKGEQPLDELTVQVWLLYDHPNFKYCKCKWGGIMDGRTDRRTDDLITRCPGGPFRPRAYK